MTIKGNIGEWSEIYTLLKILGDETLYAGDASLEKLEGVIYPVIKVLRTEASGEYEYCLDQDLVFITSDGTLLLKLPVADFADKAAAALEAILDHKQQNGRGTFSIPEIEQFMTKISCQSLKAESSKKTDITIVIHDEKTNHQPTLGFSIKSQLGSPSTLLNASKSTNFKYKVNNLTEAGLLVVNAINGKGKILKRISEIKKLGGKIEFEEIVNPIFSGNLTLIDSRLPEIMGEILLNSYSADASTVSNLVNDLESTNPLAFNQSNNHLFYTYKIKKMLTDMALGLTPAKVWAGKYDATGGYLVVKDDGEILCYHLYNRNEFEDYLFSNTRLITPSTTKIDFGDVCKENRDMYLNLNLQIRFTK